MCPFVVAAFELTLAEGNRLEKRLFHATFATVRARLHIRVSEWSRWLMLTRI